MRWPGIYSPWRLAEIDLVLAHADDLIGARGREDAQLQGGYGYIELSEIENTQTASKPQEIPTARRRLIAFKESPKHLPVGRTKAYELINTGKIIACKQGRQTMIDADSIGVFQAALPRIEPGSLRPTRGRRPAEHRIYPQDSQKANNAELVGFCVDLAIPGNRKNREFSYGWMMYLGPARGAISI